jgi:endonuclease/exonuclease/phosphatase family metal-dependent hydrolase
MLLGWNIHGSYVQLLPKIQEDSEEKGIRIMSYNVRLFDLYNWSENTQTRDKILQLIEQEDPDVVCFQEFYHTDREGVFETRDTLLKIIPFVDLHEKYTHKMRGQQYFGVATFSKFPIVGRGEIPFETDYNNFCIYTDLAIDGDTIRVFNTHMASIRFQKEDYTFLESSESPENTIEGGQRIMKRLLAAAISRTEQCDRINKPVKESPFDVILCGDFNDTPVSYAYQTLRESLDDAFIAKGSGIGNTYIGAFPSFRIDYILYSESLETLSFDVLPEKHSDHHAIVAEFLK